MSYEVIWRLGATDAAIRYLKDDPDGLRQVFAAVDLLVDDPRPTGSAAYGSPDLRRKVQRTDCGSLRGKIHLADDFDEMPDGWDEIFGTNE